MNPRDWGLLKCKHNVVEPVYVSRFLTRLICKSCGYWIGSWESKPVHPQREELSEKDKEKLK